MAENSADDRVIEALLRQLVYLARRTGDGRTALEELRSKMGSTHERELASIERVAVGEAEAGAAEEISPSGIGGWEAWMAASSRAHGGDGVTALVEARDIAARLCERLRGVWAALMVPTVYFAVVLAIGLATSYFVLGSVLNGYDHLAVTIGGQRSVLLPHSRMWSAVPVVLMTGVAVLLLGLGALVLALRRRTRRLHLAPAWMERVPGVCRMVVAYHRSLALNVANALICSGVAPDRALALAGVDETAGPDFMANAPEIGLALGPMTAAHLGSELAYARHCETVPEEVAYLAAESVNGLEDASVRTRAFFVPFAYVLVALAILTLLVSIYLPLAGLGSLV